MSESVTQWFARWFGRQVGHVKGAVETTLEKTVYENKTVEEVKHPADPKLVLRRTTIDEAILKKDRP